MTHSALVHELSTLLDFVSKEINAFVEVLSTEEKETRGSIEKWSAKDVLTHLVFWGDHFNAKLTNGKSGDKAPVAGNYIDQVNDGVLIQHEKQSFSEALAELKQSYATSRALLNGFSADDFLKEGLLETLGNRTLFAETLITFTLHIPSHLSGYLMQSNRRDMAIALQESITEKLRVFPDWDGYAIYNLACFYARNGIPANALKNLKTAFDLKPDLIAWAKQDSDLDGLRELVDFKALINAG